MIAQAKVHNDACLTTLAWYNIWPKNLAENCIWRSTFAMDKLNSLTHIDYTMYGDPIPNYQIKIHQ